MRADKGFARSGKKARELVERAGPAFLMAARRVLVVQARMRQRELGTARDGAQANVDARFARIFGATGPAPAHAQPLRPGELEIFAARLVLAAVAHAEADPEKAADARIALGRQHRAVV